MNWSVHLAHKGFFQPSYQTLSNPNYSRPVFDRGPRRRRFEIVNSQMQLTTGISYCLPPRQALLRPYMDIDGCYTDCFVADIKSKVDLQEFVTAFYTTPLFKIERSILRLVFAKPSSDEEALQVALGQIEHFAAWDVEERSDLEMVMRDFSGRTRSWFMVQPAQETTRIYFGSAILPGISSKPDQQSIGWVATLLLGPHRLYSKALLLAAKRQLVSQPD